jgi:uncharacterized membrane protein
MSPATPAVFWPALLGLSFLAAGIVAYRRDLRPAGPREAFGLVALGPAFVAASLAAFAGEHFTAARSLAGLIPKWLPAPLSIAYFVGVAHLAAGSSFVARRFVRWSAPCLAIMFALFVLLMDLPAAVAHPTTRILWSLAARETTFAAGGLALWATAVRDRRPRLSRTLASLLRPWTALVLVFYGIENVLYPRYWPGVPSTVPTAAWVPLPRVTACVIGILLAAFGVAMIRKRHAGTGPALAGLLMTLLTLALYVPKFFVARGVPEQVNALNFVFDTLLFAGTMLVIARALLDSDAPRRIEEVSSGRDLP